MGRLKTPVRDAGPAGRGQVLDGQHPARLRQLGLADEQESPEETPLQDWTRPQVQDQDDQLQHRKVNIVCTITISLRLNQSEYKY